MIDQLRWPALAGFKVGPTTGCRRGIWGKVHGEASDYRWIARSDGFGAHCPELAGALRIGNEAVPVTATLWRRLPDRWLACSVYPSRARDRAGRLTVIEKQIAEWQPPSGIPAVVGALTLLPEIACFGDGDWWDRRIRGSWKEPGYALAIADSACPLVAADPAALPQRIEAARTGLIAAVDSDALRRFYVRLLGGRFPAWLQGPQDADPLPAAALAALLLPLPRHWADRLSLTGAVASKRIDPQDLIRNWDGYIAATGPDEDPSLNSEVESLADAMVAALFDGDPEPLHRCASVEPSRPPPAELGEDVGWLDDDLAERVSAPGLPTIDDVAPDIRCVAAPIGGLTELAPEAPPVIHLMYEFARNQGARRLNLRRFRAALQDAPLSVDPRSAAALCAWPGEIEAAINSMDVEERRLKADQLRAVAALLLPDPQRAEHPGLPRKPTIPGLLPFLALTAEEGGPRLLRLGESTCMALLKQSLTCPHPTLRGRIIDWIDVWCGGPAAPPWPGVENLLRNAVRTTRR